MEKGKHFHFQSICVAKKHFWRERIYLHLSRNHPVHLPPKLSSFVSKSTHTLILWLTFHFCVELFFCGGFEEKIEKLKEWMKIAGRSPWEKANDDVPWFARFWLEGKGGLPGVLKRHRYRDGIKQYHKLISHIRKLSTETNQSNETHLDHSHFTSSKCYSCLASS